MSFIVFYDNKTNNYGVIRNQDYYWLGLDKKSEIIAVYDHVLEPLAYNKIIEQNCHKKHHEIGV